MKQFIPLLIVAIIGATLASVPLFTSKNAIDQQYIVVFHPNITMEQKSRHITKLTTDIQGADDGSEILAVHTIGTFHAFSAKLSSKFLIEQTYQTDLIAYIEQDQRITTAAACVTQSDAIWGLDRIAEQSLFIDSVYHYPSSAGAGVDAYIVDTGINTGHTEFGGRAKFGANYAGDGQNTDCNGHGTHVAGTVGGKLYGVAKSVSLIAVKVLDCQGSGSNTGVIQGVQYVATQAKATKRPSLANMSLGGSKSTALNSAVDQAVASGGVSFLVAAGNENTDACTKSPASAAEAVSVGATTIADKGTAEIDARASFSNYGSCVDILAPGQLIKSAWIGSTTATNTISGTSMATPHVAGVTALYLGENPTSNPATVKKWLTSQATPGLVDLVCTTTACRQTPNLLLHHPC